MPFAEVIPRKWQGEGFQRKVRLTSLAFLAICRDNNISTEEELWALAVDYEAKGD